MSTVSLSISKPLKKRITLMLSMILIRQHTPLCLPIQQMYINGHFCYAYKFGIMTNGLGIVRDITFYNKGFLGEHPNIIIEKKSDFPDEDKNLADSKALIPVLSMSLQNPCTASSCGRLSRKKSSHLS
jgi:hypothetical protein